MIKHVGGDYKINSDVVGMDGMTVTMDSRVMMVRDAQYTYIYVV